MQPITENVYGVPRMSIGRIYLITGKDGLTLIDTSLSPKTAEKLEPRLEAMGFGFGDIKNILITHAHPDHIGGLAELQRHSNARTAIHHRDAAVVRGERPAIQPTPNEVEGIGWKLMAALPLNPTIIPARVDLELKGGDTLDDILPGLQVIELHGHSPGQVGYWWKEKRLLIGGDVLMHLPWGLALPLPGATPNMAEAKRSIRKVAEMDVDILCFGHGTPLFRDAAARVRAFAQKIKV